MADQEIGAASAVKPSPGDVIAIETDRGTRYVQVTHLQSPYPDVVRAIRPPLGADAAEELAKGATAFIAMVELGRALRDEAVSAKVIGHAVIPQDCRAFPTFRLPIRNKAGEVVYWWAWDGSSLRVAPEAADSDMPVREIVSVDVLRCRLAELA